MRGLLTDAPVDLAVTRLPGADHVSVIEHPDTLHCVHGWPAAADEG